MPAICLGLSPQVFFNNEPLDDSNPVSKEIMRQIHHSAKSIPKEVFEFVRKVQIATCPRYALRAETCVLAVPLQVLHPFFKQKLQLFSSIQPIEEPAAAGIYALMIKFPWDKPIINSMVFSYQPPKMNFLMLEGQGKGQRTTEILYDTFTISLPISFDCNDGVDFINRFVIDDRLVLSSKVDVVLLVGTPDWVVATKRAFLDARCPVPVIPNRAHYDVVRGAGLLAHHMDKITVERDESYSFEEHYTGDDMFKRLKLGHSQTSSSDLGVASSSN